MSRDLQNFVSAFGVGFSIGDRVNQRNRQFKIDQQAGADYTNPELEEFDRKNGRISATSPGMHTPIVPVSASGQRRGATSGWQFAGGGMVPEGYVDDPSLSPEERRRRWQAAMFPTGKPASIQRSGPMSTPDDPTMLVDDPADMSPRHDLYRARATGGMTPTPPPDNMDAAYPYDDYSARNRDRQETGGTTDAQRVAPASTALPDPKVAYPYSADRAYDPRRSGRATQAAAPLERPAAFDQPMTVPTGQLPDYEATNALETQDGGKTGGVPRFDGASPASGGAGGDTAAGTDGQQGTGTGAPGSAARSGGATAAATGGAGGAGGGRAGKPVGRKSLKDQTRTEAFNPEDPADMAEADDVTKAAIKGGMAYAANLFHLGNPQDPNFQRGADAFYQGTGAPDPQTMQAVDQTVQRVAPDDYSGPLGKAKLQLRRMEIIYRWAVQNGNTDRANKMAFEIMQYAAGTAAQYGTQAVQALKGGDLRGGATLVAQALDEVPDGYNVQAGPNGEITYTDSNGRVISQQRMTPEQLFNAAMGLSNRSMYWKILNERAQMVPAAAKAANADERSALRGVRMETERLRQEKLRQGIAKGNASKGGGGAVASPVADALADIRSRMPARGGVLGAAPVAATPPQGSDDGSADDEEDEPVEQGDSTAGSGNPPRPAGAPGPNSIKPAPNSVLRTKPPAPNQGTFQQAQPTGASQTSPSAAAPAKGAAVVPTGNEGRGGAPAQLPAQESEDTFDEPHPLAEFKGRDPYADILAGIDPKTGKQNPAITQYWATKQGRAERSNIIAEQRALNRDIKDWERRKKEFDKAQAAASKEGKGVKPRDVKATDDLSTTISSSIKIRTDDKAKPNTFNDGYSDPKTVSDIAMDLVTNNPNLPSERALDFIGDMTNNGTGAEERALRAYEVLGYADKSKKQVVLSPKGQPNVRLRMSIDAFQRMHDMVDKRWEATQKAQEKGTWGKVWDQVMPPQNRKPSRVPFIM